jgi:hypothetical protein
MSTPITVTSHVARDFLHNADYFNTVPKVVWEYVSNAIDSPGPSGVVTVNVQITRERIVISDDGTGMNRSDLQRFFQMHGENIKRKQGKRVRGRFGTGKCAAFGVASRMRIETVHDGRLNVVELSRKVIESSSGGAVPVQEIATDAPTAGTNGTTVIIADLHTSQLEIPATIAYVQRHLGRRQQGNRVIINEHICEFEEPISVKTREFRAPAAVAERIGDVVATVKVAPAPLDTDSAGIDVLSYGNWHDTTLADLPINDWTRRIFGEVDVPALEDYEGPFPPFDNTRNNTLSRRNPLVVILFAWLSESIKEMLAELEREEAERRRSAEAKRLRMEAEKIERIINEDFRTLEMELERARHTGPKTTLPMETVGIGRPNPTSGTILPDPTGAMPIDQVAAGIVPGQDGRRVNPDGVGDEERPGSGLLPGAGPGAPRDPIQRSPRRPSGFRLEYMHETEAASRSRYDPETKTIVINLDHPQVQAAAKLGGQESIAFRQLSYELAFVEYALALEHEHTRRDPTRSSEDSLYHIRDTINRVARRLADVF